MSGTRENNNASDPKMPKNPFGLHSVTPVLVVEDVERLADFIETVFDGSARGEPRRRDDGSVRHHEMRIGDSVVMMSEPEEGMPVAPGTLRVYVDACDEVYERALASGGAAVGAPEDLPHGDRQAGVQDPVGNLWWIASHTGRTAPR